VSVSVINSFEVSSDIYWTLFGVLFAVNVVMGYEANEFNFFWKFIDSGNYRNTVIITVWDELKVVNVFILNEFAVFNFYTEILSPLLVCGITDCLTKFGFVTVLACLTGGF